MSFQALAGLNLSEGCRGGGEVGGRAVLKRLANCPRPPGNTVSFQSERTAWGAAVKCLRRVAFSWGPSGGWVSLRPGPASPHTLLSPSRRPFASCVSEALWLTLGQGHPRGGHWVWSPPSLSTSTSASGSGRKHQLRKFSGKVPPGVQPGCRLPHNLAAH